MPSLIPGYEYDIFISYRQKDNKHDGWVSEFVNQLKGELEATFKEEVSVYFDNNPHDGLLETHDVDESLKEKLRCLIFIPVVSRTYCDPKSFAWEHEFKAFVDIASNDRFGMKVKLPSGNVASRVLPVRIHDLESEDVKLFEGISGSVMRSLDFIFKTASGVNRPLKAKEDHPADNLNKTYYQDQINKVALAIKEIISAMEHFKPQAEIVSAEVYEPKIERRKYKKSGIIAGSITILILIILSIFFIPELLRTEAEPRKSIAVLPFRNDSPDPDNESFCNGMMEDILDNLVNIGDLEVKSRTDVEQYRGTKKLIKEIARELTVKNILEGSVRKQGNRFRLSVQLINAETGNHLWSDSYEGTYSDTIWTVTSSIAQQVASALKAVITKDEKDKIETFPTTNMQAYDYYSKGSYEKLKYWADNDKRHLYEAQRLFDKALEIDPEFEKAIYEKTDLYLGLGEYDSLLICANRMLSIDPESGDAYFLKGEVFRFTHLPDSAIENYLLAIKYLKPESNRNKHSQFMIGIVYCNDKYDYNNGLTWIKKGFPFERENKWGAYYNTVQPFLAIGDYELAEKYLRKSMEYEVNPLNIQEFWWTLIAQSRFDEALTFLNSICKQPESLAGCYHSRYFTFVCLKDFPKAEQYYTQFLNAGGTPGAGDSLILAYIYRKTGREQLSTIILNNCRKSLKSRLVKTQTWSLYLTLSYIPAILENKDEANRYLAQATDLKMRSGWHDIITFFPVFECLWDDPEFKAIVKRAQDEKAAIRAHVDEIIRQEEWTLE